MPKQTRGMGSKFHILLTKTLNTGLKE